jgi:hypothetical protein
MDSITLGKDGTQIREHMDQSYLEERRPGCARVAVPRTILPEDVTEPTTGIKFPSLLVDNSNRTAIPSSGNSSGPFRWSLSHTVSLSQEM